LPAFLAFLLGTVSGLRAETIPTDNSAYGFELLGDGAVIARAGPATMFPTVVRVPGWLAPEERADPSANYYLYYSQHRGKHIFMSWAQNLAGPWHEFDLGGRFNGHIRHGVLDIRSDSSRETFDHLAAPDVHVDDELQQFIMFFHAQNQPDTTDVKGQIVPRLHESFVATSRDGLNFFDPETSGGQAGHGPKTVTSNGVTRDLWIAGPYQRAFRYRGDWYSVSKRGIIDKARSSLDPWSGDSDHAFGRAWLQERTPSGVWFEDASRVQHEYFSPAATFLASSEFAEHPNNPNPGVRISSKINSNEDRLNHLSVVLTEDGKLEVFFYVRADPADRFNAIYRVVYDLDALSYEDWSLARDESGLVIFDVVVTPEQVAEAVRSAHGNVDPRQHADPVSLGSSFVFVDDAGGKYLFFAYVSGVLGGAEGEGQIAAVKLLPLVSRTQPPEVQVPRPVPGG
jgi:hypothetical protein